jgi:deoxyribonuclease-4
VAHAPYTLNACAADEKKRTFALDTFKDDLARLEYTPGNYYNFHPGSHVGQGVEKGIEYISALLNESLKPDQSTTVLLETMAGKGSEVGSNFSELREIIDRVSLKEKLGVCLDTCHVWDAGYDIVNDLDGVLLEFDRIIGLDRLKAIHLNDSLNPLGAHKDRHARIGEGHLGLEAITRIINHPQFKGLPFCLETPCDIDGYKKEIELLRGLYKG